MMRTRLSAEVEATELNDRILSLFRSTDDGRWAENPEVGGHLMSQSGDIRTQSKRRGDELIHQILCCVSQAEGSEAVTL